MLPTCGSTSCDERTRPLNSKTDGLSQEREELLPGLATQTLVFHTEHIPSVMFKRNQRLCGVITRMSLLSFACVLLFMLYMWSTGPTKEQEVELELSVEFEPVLCSSSESDYRQMVDTLRTRFLVPPDPSVPYNLTEKSRYETSQGQVLIVRRILNHMPNGFFVEVGGYDGETGSNTLTLERELNWTGLLVEPSPLNYELLEQRRRRVFVSRSCLSTKPCEEEVKILNNKQESKILESVMTGDVLTPATCFPLYAYLLALERLTVDYFSLDVEGQELAVLKTIPWDKVDIKVLSVENCHIPEGKQALRSYMESVGYSLESEIYVARNYLGWDDIYVKNSLV